MGKKILFVALVWIVVAVTILVLYCLREVSPMKAFTDWALGIWPILAVLVTAAIALTGWIVKHDFKHTKEVLPQTISNHQISMRLCNIPKTIYKMHERLTYLVKRMPLLTKIEIETLQEDYCELLGLDESHYPELKQITPISDVKAEREVLGAVLDKFISTFIEMEMDDVKLLLIRIGGLMNVKGKGISQIRDHDRQYTRLERRLAKLRPEIPIELNTAVDDYLQFSFGFLSMYRLILAVPYGEITTNVLPSKYSAEMGIWKERMDVAMNELLAEVSSLIEKLRYEIANSPSTSCKEGRPQK